MRTKILWLFSLLLIFSVRAYALPCETNYIEQDGKILITKTFEVSPDADPNTLIDKDFELDGYRYSYTDMSKQEIEAKETRTETKTVTVKTPSNNLTTIINKLYNEISYNENGFEGTLVLDKKNLNTVAEGYANKSYTINETKEYSGLERNDPYYIPKTITKDGVTLTLGDVSWSEYGQQPLYKAVAVYSGTGSSKYATGYITTAKYSGEVSKAYISKVIYTLTYTGEKSTPKYAITYPLIGLLFIVPIIGMIAWLIFRKKNVKIFNLQNDNYVLIDKQRVSSKNPIIYINRTYKATGNCFAIVLSIGLVKKLKGKEIIVSNKEKISKHLVQEQKGEYWFKIVL